ncbi:exportin-t [Quercus suber]|uniref:Exportin-t n=1 Tax=Quercus suber TaxID=58331 RepID=A0AAW0LQ88_QUESU
MVDTLGASVFPYLPKALEQLLAESEEPGEIEEEFAHAGTARIIKRFLTSRSPRPPCIPKGGFITSPNTTLPAWLCEEDVNYSVSKFDNRGFTGGLNYYRALDLYVLSNPEKTPTPAANINNWLEKLARSSSHGFVICGQVAVDFAGKAERKLSG